MFKRPIFNTILNRIMDEKKFIQVLAGPRQTGKTTIAQQLIKKIDFPAHYCTADEPTLKDYSWIEQQWEVGRLNSKMHQKSLLIFDEIQKISNWSETIKKLWDEDKIKQNNLHVILLGSSQLLMQSGLSESLAGRFEIINITHWTFVEMNTAFNWNLDEYIYYGGYPGSAALINEPQRWTQYIKDSIIETTISKDILLMTRVDKPILLRRLFELSCAYSGQILSYQKMTGQLQDAGNTTTLAHYLNLLDNAGLVVGLQKYAGQQLRRKNSSPKLIVKNTALLSAQMELSFKEAQQHPEIWGRFVESAIGSYLCNETKKMNLQLFYWNGKNKEVDFVIKKGYKIIAIEVKSTAKRTNLSGISEFSRQFEVHKKLLIGSQGISIEDFLKTPIEFWFE